MVVHGDFRLGNVMVGAEGLRAVLDWELCTIGDPVAEIDERASHGRRPYLRRANVRRNHMPDGGLLEVTG